MKLLVLRLSALGDVIHTIPAVMMLRDAAEVTWVVEAAYAELVEIVARVATIPVRMKRWRRTLLSSRTEMRSARHSMRGFDAAVDFQGLMKSAMLASIARTPIRIGFDRDAIREKGALWFLNRTVQVDRSAHVVDWNLQLAAGAAQTLGIEVSGRPAHWADFPSDPSFKLTHLAGRIVLVPGAGKANKQWPVDRFREVARHFGDRALVVWGPDEHELAQSIGGPIAPATNLRELAWLLSKAAVVVAGDTGPLHLAAALGVPVVGLYGPTDPRRNGPYGQLASTISRYESARTMEGITAAEVIAGVEGRMG